jgi:hypothetical protein
VKRLLPTLGYSQQSNRKAARGIPLNENTPSARDQPLIGAVNLAGVLDQKTGASAPHMRFKSGDLPPTCASDGVILRPRMATLGLATEGSFQ